MIDTGESFMHGRVLDVSVGGAFVHTRKMIPVGTAVTITPVEEATDHVFELRAKVVRHVQGGTLEDPPGVGLQFIRPGLPEVVGLLKLFGDMPETRKHFLEDLAVAEDRPGRLAELAAKLRAKRSEAA